MSQYRQQLVDLVAAVPNLIVKYDDFEYGDQIGSGGFGNVYRATQKSTGRDCAIKKIFNERIEGNKLRRYLGEIETMSFCDNMFLVPLVGFTAEPPYCIVTEFMPNGSLDRFVRQKNNMRLSGTQLTTIAMGIAYGMIHLHKIGIIHRDLKAANIMLDLRLFPRIGDFGIARFSDADLMTAKIGTPNYMAPELIRSHEYDGKVDVYSYGMILYEMTQSVRPFNKMKMDEIFNCVLNYNRRPQFYEPVPDQLRYLIEACWATNPAERPTFSEIYQAFASGAVSFADTRVDNIPKFIQVITRDEERRGRKKGEQSYSTDNYTYEYSTDDDFINFSDEKDWHPGDKNVFSYDNEYYEEDYYEEDGEYYSTEIFDTQKLKMQILCNPKSPKFVKTVEDEGRLITQATFFDFYKIMSTHLKHKIPPMSLKTIIRVFLAMMKRDKNFIPLLNQGSFFLIVPTNNKDVIDDVISCFACLFIDYPRIIGKQHLPSITDLLARSPDKMLILHSYYVKKLLTYNNPWPLLDNLLTVQKIMVNKSCGYMYLSIFSYLISTYELYKKERSFHIRTIFLNFINSKEPNNVKAAYDGLSKLFTDYTSIDFTKMIQHLKDPFLSKSVLSLLMRIDEITVTQELIDTLLSLTENRTKIWISILHIASSKKGSRILIENQEWMTKCGRNNIDALRVFLVLFKKEGNRSKLTQSGTFLKLLKSCINRKDKKSHTAIATILRRTEIDQRMIDLLDSISFLSSFADAAEKSKKPKMIRNVLNVLDYIARIGFSKEYCSLIPLLIEQIKYEDNATAAMTVIVTLSFHNECAKEFGKKSELVDYFRGLFNFEEYIQLAGSFLKNII